MIGCSDVPIPAMGDHTPTIEQEFTLRPQRDIGWKVGRHP